MAASTYLIQQLLDHAFGVSVYTAPATLYVGLSFTAVGIDGSGISEPGGTYARFGVAGSGWNSATNGQPSVVSNVADIVFPVPGAPYGSPVLYWFIADALTAGNLLWCGPLNKPRVVMTSDDVRIQSGNLTLTAI